MILPELPIILSMKKSLMRLQVKLICLVSAVIGIKESPLSKDKDIAICWIPRCDKALGMADLDSVGLWEKGAFFRTYGKISTKEKVKRWGTEGKECDKEMFVQKSGELIASRVAYKAIESSQSFFEALDTLSSEQQ